MATPAIDNRPLRYATSFAVIFGAVGISTAGAIAIPDSLPYSHALEVAVLTAGVLAGVELFWRIEEGRSPYRQFLRHLYR